ncbi:hypothetical protein Leryth_013275 [Lithospermum erythrorhizon]|nr:hypothetical protein Leryth_013275 [Lithospermum erythrorhizon]
MDKNNNNNASLLVVQVYYLELVAAMINDSVCGGAWDRVGMLEIMDGDYLDLTVGGTLSNAGVSGQAFHSMNGLGGTDVITQCLQPQASN